MNDLIPSHDTERFYLFVLIVLGIVALLVLSKTVQNYIQQVLVEKASFDMKNDLLKHVRKLGFPYYEKHPAGETLSLFHTEAEAVDQIYRNYFPYVVKESLFGLICIIVMLTIHIQLTLIMVPCVLTYYFLGPFLAERASLAGQALTKDNVSLNKKVYDSLSGLIEIRANRCEKWDAERLNQRHEKLNRSFEKYIKYMYARGAMRRVSIYLGAIIVFIYGALLVQKGQLNTGEFIAFTILYFMAVENFTLLIIDLTEQRLLLFQAGRIWNVIHKKPEVEESPHPIRIQEMRGLIEFRNVSFGYDEQRPIVTNFNCVIRPGEKVALVGYSGCGKTTLLKLLMRFYDVKSGEIRIDSVPIKQMSFEQLRERIGVVFQDTYLFGTSIKENIRFGNPEATDEEIVQASMAANAHEFITKLPNGYDTYVGERGNELSGGQKQRIAIARMLIKNPAIVVLDEATSALDNINEAEVQRALDTLLAGRTTVCVAHKLTTIKEFDKIIVMDKGKMIEMGTFNQLMNNKKLFFNLWNSTRVTLT